MKITKYIWLTLFNICLIGISLGVYDHHFKTIQVIQSPPPSFTELSFKKYIKSGGNATVGGAVNFVEAARKSKSSVVYITAYEKVKSTFYKNEHKLEKGSGVIISRSGDIVTNYHVISNADHIRITLDDKREYIAEVIGTDESTDLALLKIEGQGFPHLVFADSDSLQVGEWILTIGNPFGLQSTVTAGIVSAKARNIDILDKNDIESFIQSDAVINPGSSGGALVNTAGELMGICTAIISKSGNYEGLSFAIPSNIANKVIVDLKEFGAVQRGKFGITITDVDAKLSKKISLPFIKGVYINALHLNSAAADAGLKKQDVIVTLGTHPVNSSAEFYEELNKYRPGDRITIKYYRQGEVRTSHITLRNYLNTTDYITIRNDKILRDIGMEIRNLNSIEKSRVQTQGGVMVISVSKGSIINNTNMEPGYIVQYFNEIKIKNVQQFLSLLKDSKEKVTLRGFYERYPGDYPYSFRLE